MKQALKKHLALGEPLVLFQGDILLKTQEAIQS